MKRKESSNSRVDKNTDGKMEDGLVIKGNVVSKVEKEKSKVEPNVMNKSEQPLKNESVKKPKKKKQKPPKLAISNNWLSLSSTLNINNKRTREDETPEKYHPKKKKPIKNELPPLRLVEDKSITKEMALDCEMVGVGIEGKEHMLARVVIVNNVGHVILDRYVAPKERVVDYRTQISGITPNNLIGAPSFEEVQKEVADLIKDKILIGHSLESDLKALLLSHPRHLIRDTAKYIPLMRPRKNKKPKPHALRHLALTQLRVKIQSGEHDPAIDARAALLLYLKHKKEWEQQIEKHLPKNKFKRKRSKKSKNNNNNNNDNNSGDESDDGNNDNGDDDDDHQNDIRAVIDDGEDADFLF